MKKLQKEKSYTRWLANLKQKVRNTQLKAVVAVNRELLDFYWELGAEIVSKQTETHWGSKFLPQVSIDLMAEFPEMKGFSLSNLKYIKQWYLFYSRNGEISQQAVGQITQIPWGHNIAIISKCKNIEEAFYYVQSTITQNWSRSVLVHQIESGLYQREGKAITNFTNALPAPQSDLANQTP